jgi:hypothetical protein
VIHEEFMLIETKVVSNDILQLITWPHPHGPSSLTHRAKLENRSFISSIARKVGADLKATLSQNWGLPGKLITLPLKQPSTSVHARFLENPSLSDLLRSMEVRFAELKWPEEEGGAIGTQERAPGEPLTRNGVLLKEEEMWPNFLHFQ